MKAQQHKNNPKMGHFVPVSYLKRFVDKKGFLHIFDRSSSSFRRQIPEKVMKINAYYRQEWAPPGMDPNIFENEIGGWLETIAKNSIDRLIQAPNTLTEEDSILVNYIELQRIRVPRQAEIAKELFRQTFLQLAPPDVVSAIQNGEVTLTIKDLARFKYMRMMVGKLHPWFGQMEWTIYQAEEGSSFITTDSPVSLFNAAIALPAEPGIALAGTIVFFPLSSRHLLLMRHPIIRKNSDISFLTVLPDPPKEDMRLSITHGIIWDAKSVNNFNKDMLRLSDKLIVAESKEVLEKCIQHN